MTTLTEEGGTFSTLIAEDGPLPKTMADLESAAASFKEIASKLEQDTGLLGRLVNDEQWSEAMAADVKALVENLESISRKIDEGEGTLGQLVNERVLHDGLEQVVAGVGDSKFARWLVKHYRKKGIKLDQEDLKELGIE